MDTACEDAKTSLHVAAEEGHVDVVAQLLERGAERDVLDAHGEGALLHAVRKRQHPVVSLLLERGADPDCANSERYSTASQSSLFEGSYWVTMCCTVFILQMINC